jgi:hypothetical protein
MTPLRADDIRIAEVLYRSEAHLLSSCELYGMGRKPDALLQAARPITDVLPSLETEIRSAEEQMREFFTTTAQIGAGIRRNEKPRALRRAMKDVARTRSALVDALAGDSASTPEFKASVAIALLAGTTDRYRAAVDDGNLGDYQAAYGVASIAIDLLREARLDRNERLTPLLRSLDASLPAIEPPARLTRPDDYEGLVEKIAIVAAEEAGAVRVTWTMTDSLDRISRALDDVVSAYERGHGPVAARLAATVFVRLYDPIRHELSSTSPDEAARLTSLLGFELRTAINRGAPPPEVGSIAEQAQRTLQGLVLA